MRALNQDLGHPESRFAQMGVINLFASEKTFFPGENSPTRKFTSFLRRRNDTAFE